ncbi:MAG: adenylate/guanylate cyclase domain-containing protein [Planctomycetota bacterium]
MSSIYVFKLQKKGFLVPQEGFKRKLTAILSADVIGYSRLMRDNEEATVRDLAAHRVLITEIIQQHHGRVVDSPGDNILAEFASVVDAVNGAIKIQEEIKKSNTGISEDRRMEFRIGINLGDVIEEDERIYGDGVNIAARVEGLSAAGGISISGTVYEHIKDKLSLGYHYLGEQNVKNIPEPVRVYQILTAPEAAGKVIGEEKPEARNLRWAAFSALALIIVVGGALGIWKYYFRTQIEPASLDKMAFPLPDKPSIAVLPFTNMSGDPAQDYLGDGLAEGIITSLSKMPGVFVIARNSTFVYKEKAVKISQVAEELGVRYVLEGSVQRSGDNVRITAQLIDAVTGSHLWAERYDASIGDLFDFQDRITQAIVTELQVELSEGEMARIRRKGGTKNIRAWELNHRALKTFRQLTKEDNARARALAEEASKLDPGYAGAWVMQAYTHMMNVRLGSSKSPAESINKAVELAQKGLALDPTNSDAIALLGRIKLLKRDYAGAIELGKKAVALHPNHSIATALLASTLTYAGRPEESIRLYKKAMRLSPYYPVWYLWGIGLAYHLSGQYEEALEALNKGVARNRDYIRSHVALAALHADRGRNAEARAAAHGVLRIDPKFTLEKWAKVEPFSDAEIIKRRRNLLRKAGIPD